MTFNVNGAVVSLLIACLVWFLFDIAINTLVKDAKANEVFHVVLLFVCLFIVFVGGFFRF